MTLIVNDLELDEKLDTEAMRTVFGGSYALLRARQNAIGQSYLGRTSESATSFVDTRSELQRRAMSIMTQHQQQQARIFRNTIY